MVVLRKATTCVSQASSNYRRLNNKEEVASSNKKLTSPKQDQFAKPYCQCMNDGGERTCRYVNSKL
jgi:hypothetical protein